MDDLSGRKFGQFTLLERINSGGMGDVYKARQESVSRSVAVKVIRSQLAQEKEFVERFEREASTLANLSHPHILKLFDYGREGEDLIYLVMELLTGGSLSAEIKRGKIPLDRTTKLLEEIGEALDYAHSRGVIHRDLKPQNILLDENGNAYLTDFGIAKLLTSESTNLTSTGLAMGTPKYMAPEQWYGNPVDARTDVYAFGIISFEMLSGQSPFDAPTPSSLMYKHLNEQPRSLREFRRDLPPTVEKVIHKALAKAPHVRYGSAGEFARDLKHTLAGLPINDDSDSAPTMVVTDPPAPPRKAPTLLSGILIGIVALAAVLVLAVFLLLGNGNPSATAYTPTQAAAAADTISTDPATATATATPAIEQTTASTEVPALAQAVTDTATVALAAAATITEAPTSTATVTDTATATATETATATPLPTNTDTPTPLPTLTFTPVPTVDVGATIDAIFTATGNAIATQQAIQENINTSVAASATAIRVLLDVQATLTAESFTDTPIPASPTFTPLPMDTATAVPPTPVPAATEPSAIAAAAGIAGQVVTLPIGMKLVYVPAGCFPMGANPLQDNSAQPNEMPQHQVCLTYGYWIGQFEVTNAEYQQFINAGGYSDSQYWSEEGWSWKREKNSTAPRFFHERFNGAQQPVVGVSRYEAEAFANWIGGRLPTEAEWEYAARGPQGFIYPWGNTFNPALLNAGTTLNSTKPVGSYPDGVSWCGAYDMAGNVHEWMADWYDRNYYQQNVTTNPTGPAAPVESTYVSLRSGSWVDPDYSLSKTTSRHRLHPYGTAWNLGIRLVFSEDAVRVMTGTGATGGSGSADTNTSTNTGASVVSNINTTRPASVSFYQLHASIFYDTPSKRIIYRDMTQPGTQEYAVTVQSSEVRGLGFAWCGDDVVQLEQIVAPVTVKLYVDGVQVPDAQMMVADAATTTEICRRWMTLVGGWNSGQVVTLEIRITIAQDVFDGVSTYAAGEYTHRLVVTVQ